MSSNEVAKTYPPPPQVTAKDDASADDVAALKQHVKDQGGEITHEYTLIKGFAYVLPSAPLPFSIRPAIAISN